MTATLLAQRRCGVAAHDNVRRACPVARPVRCLRAAHSPPCARLLPSNRSTACRAAPTEVCDSAPVAAGPHWQQALDDIASGNKVTVVQVAPAVRVAIAETMGLGPGEVSTGQLVAGLRKLGFNYVFDTLFGADLTIMEEGTELLHRLQEHLEQHPDKDAPMPMFTSCCPGWVNMVEMDYPELIPHLSTAKSPQAMFGAVVKTYWAEKMGIKPEDICLVSVMPCVAKKYEAQRPEMANYISKDQPDHGEGHHHLKVEEGAPHVDHVITTRELGAMIRLERIPMASLKPEAYDDPMGIASGAAVLFGNTGGVMEAAVRTVYSVVTGHSMPRLELDQVRGMTGIKEATLSLQPKEGGPSKQVRIAVANGIANAKALLKKIQAGEAQYEFVEVMTCPGGCIGGGGQPRSKDPLAILKRMQSVYNIDEAATIRESHANPDIQRLYKEYMGQPCSEKSHALLHTTYRDRSEEVHKLNRPSPGKCAAAAAMASTH